MLEREFLEDILVRAGRALVLFALFGFWVNLGNTSAETKPLSTPKIRTYPVPGPQVYDKAINEHRFIERAKFALNESISVDLFEQPRSIENYDSILKIMAYGKKPEIFHIGRLVECPELRLVHAALVRANSTRGMLILEYEGGGIGAREGFAVLRFDRYSARVHVLPITNFGKIVINRDDHDLAELWSGDDCLSLPPDAEGCEYTTRICKWKEDGYSCDQPKKMDRVFNHNDISDPGIEIRP